MLDLLINLMWFIISIFVGFAVVYSLVRIVAIAWHRTKRDFDTLPYISDKYPKRKPQNDEEL